MANTEFGTADAQTVKVWNADCIREAIGETYMKRFLGEGQDSIIKWQKDLEESAGDEIKYDLRVQDRNPGVQGDTRLKDFESRLQFYQDSVKIDQLRQGHAFGRMSQQRTLHDLRKESRASLASWFARNFDGLMFAYLAGTAGTDSEAVSNILGSGGFAGNALAAPDSNHVITTGTSMVLANIDRLVARAKTLNPRIRPAMVDGSPKYVLVMHPHTVYQLKIALSASAISWATIQANAGMRGSDNPLYTGALGEYGGVILHESEYIPRVTASGLTHNLFLGANAGVFALGNAYDKIDRGKMGGGSFFKYHEDTDDHDNQKAVSGACIFGIKKTRFNSEDHGVIRLSTTDTAA
ncbi:MAG: hypothetical protein RIS45_1939 [Planctomycetota bacterium]|jgi:N4-gp56 family major capsid protein